MPDFTDHDLLYGPATPMRPPRDIESPLANPQIRLLNDSDLAAINAGRSIDGTVTWPCTPLVETATDGSRLEARPYAGLALPAADRYRNTCFIGATGSGKTYYASVPHLLATLAATNESAVHTNLRGPACTEELKAAIQCTAPDAEVLVFAPGDAQRSIACNLVGVARRHGLLPLVARFIGGAIPRGQHESGFWEAVTKKVIPAALRLPGITSLAALHELLSNPKLFAECAKTTGDPELLDFCDFRASSSNGSTAGIHMASCTAPLAENDAARAVTSGPDELDFVELLSGEKRFVLIIECNESQFEDLRHLVGLFFALFFACALIVAERAGGRLPTPVSFFMDEFGAIPAIPDFPKTANLGRFRRFSFNIFTQSLQQIRSAYGPDADALLSAMCSKVFFCSGLSTIDREYASRLAGSIAVHEWRETQQPDPHTGHWLTAARSRLSTVRPLIAPDDLLLRPHPVFGGYAYAFLVDRPPIILHFTPSFEMARVASVMEAARAAPPSGRPTPLPAVPATGLVRPETLHHVSALQTLPDTRGVSPPPLTCRIAQLTDRLDWEHAGTTARISWTRFQEANRAHPGVIIQVAEELLRRGATIDEYGNAEMAADSRNPQAVLHYLDYARVVKADAGSRIMDASIQPLLPFGEQPGTCTSCGALVLPGRDVCFLCTRRRLWRSMTEKPGTLNPGAS